jgi:3-phosphoshikimate 1-carboxyvinyltransferase
MNPSRTGIPDLLTAMGAAIEVQNLRELTGEPVADLLVRSAHLTGIEIGGALVPRAIDEFPVLCVAAALAEGRTVVRDARELRVKETDRIAAMAANLRLAGATVTETEDGMVIEGRESLMGCAAESYGDHRIAMAMLVAGLVARGETTVRDVGCIATSFPDFIPLLEKVARR